MLETEILDYITLKKRKKSQQKFVKFVITKHNSERHISSGMEFY